MRLVKVLGLVGMTALSLSGCINPMSAESIAENQPIEGYEAFKLQAKTVQWEANDNYLGLARCWMSLHQQAALHPLAVSAKPNALTKGMASAISLLALGTTDASGGMSDEEIEARNRKYLRDLFHIEREDGKRHVIELSERSDLGPGRQPGYIKTILLEGKGANKTLVTEFLHPHWGAPGMNTVIAKGLGGVDNVPKDGQLEMAIWTRYHLPHPNKVPLWQTREGQAYLDAIRPGCSTNL